MYPGSTQNVRYLVKPQPVFEEMIHSTQYRCLSTVAKLRAITTQYFSSKRISCPPARRKPAPRAPFPSVTGPHSGHRCSRHGRGAGLGARVHHPARWSAKQDCEQQAATLGSSPGCSAAVPKVTVLAMICSLTSPCVSYWSSTTGTPFWCASPTLT